MIWNPRRTVADLSSLTADQLAETVRDKYTSYVGIEDYPEADEALAELVRRLKTAEDALDYYAERHNYRLAAGEPVCSDYSHGHACGMEHRDAYDDSGSGARARAALAAIRPNPKP